MSYSFQVKADTKEAVLEAAKAELDKVAASQPAHAADKDQAYTAVEAFVALVIDPAAEDKQITVSVNGSLSWTDEGRYTSASVGVNAYVGPKG